VDDKRKVSLELSDGTLLEGTLRPGWTVSEARSLLGKTMDLKSAYRQLLSCSSCRWHTVVGVWDPESRRPAYFKSDALLFGLTASVMAFNRYSRTIWRIGVDLLDLLWSNYFDDYPVVSHECLARSSDAAAKALFDVLGWTISKSPDKDKEFANAFSLLGVRLDLSKLLSGTLVVSNTDKRKVELAVAFADIAAAADITCAQAATIMGRAQFAESQLFGRWGALVLRPLRDLVSLKAGTVAVSRPLAAAHVGRQSWSWQLSPGRSSAQSA
jgi:hypothetical protein